MSNPSSLYERIRAIDICGGSTTCPIALAEEDVAKIAESEGLHLRGHAERSFLAEAVEAYVLARLGRTPLELMHASTSFLEEHHIALLLERSGRAQPDRRTRRALAADAESFVRWVGAKLAATVRTPAPNAHRLKDALLRAVSCR